MLPKQHKNISHPHWKICLRNHRMEVTNICLGIFFRKRNFLQISYLKTFSLCDNKEIGKNRKFEPKPIIIAKRTNSLEDSDPSICSYWTIRQLCCIFYRFKWSNVNILNGENCICTGSIDFQTLLFAISDCVSTREGFFCISNPIWNDKSQQVFQQVWNSMIIAVLKSLAVHLHFPHHWSL